MPLHFKGLSDTTTSRDNRCSRCRCSNLSDDHMVYSQHVDNTRRQLKSMITGVRKSITNRHQLNASPLTHSLH